MLALVSLLISSTEALLVARVNAEVPAAILILKPGFDEGSFRMFAQAVFWDASTKLTAAGMTVPAGEGVMTTAVTCTPTVPITAPLNTDSEATERVFLLLDPILAFPLAEKLLVLTTVTEAPASDELKIVVFATTLTVLLLPAVPITVLPLAVNVPTTARSELARIAALDVTGAAEFAKVVIAFTVKD